MSGTAKRGRPRKNVLSSPKVRQSFGRNLAITAPPCRPCPQTPSHLPGAERGSTLPPVAKNLPIGVTTLKPLPTMRLDALEGVHRGREHRQLPPAFSSTI